MKTILATGGMGFIGSHTCVSLIENNFNVYVIDSLENSSIENLDSIKKVCSKYHNLSKGKITFYKGDIRNKQFLKNTFKNAQLAGTPIEAVIHFAGLKSVNESIKEPLSYWETNVCGTNNLLNVMQIYNCKKIVFSSSATVYKPIENRSINEESELGPINPYGQTKLAVENMLGDLMKDKSQNWKIINLRYFNPVGAHISGLLGENPKGIPNNLFPIILKVASGESKNLFIYGDDWSTFDGTCIRDYIHVMDLADAHISALKFIMNSSPIFMNLNIGTGYGKSILEVVETFKKVNNCQLNYIFDSRREGDAPYVVADNFLALSKLNWKPMRNLDDMCRDAWRWKKKSLQR